MLHHEEKDMDAKSKKKIMDMKKSKDDDNEDLGSEVAARWGAKTDSGRY